MTGARTPESGFTLVEVLISMFIFSLISTGAFIALDSTLDAREAAEARIAELDALAVTRRLMADDIAASVLRRNRDGLGGFVDDQVRTPDPGTLTLTRRARPNPAGVFARGDLLRVSWRVENGQLIRSFLPHENPAQVEPARDRVVLDGVEAMEVRYQLSPDLLTRLTQSGQTALATLPGTITRNASGGVPQTSLIDITLIHSGPSSGQVQTRHVFEWTPL